MAWIGVILLIIVGHPVLAVLLAFFILMIGD
jgi:hypothetical protein